MKATINPDMIILAREARALSQLQLAKSIGMSATNLSKIERGDIGINPEVLDKIAAETHYPMQFFLQPGTIVPDNLAYRRRQQVPQKLLTPINAQVNIIRRQVQLLQQALQVQAPQLRVLPLTETNTPEGVADTLRRQWHIDTPVINNLTAILEQQGIAITAFNFNTPRVDSRTILTDDKHPVIIYNSTLAGDRQRFSLAYELGQLLMHTFIPVPESRDITKEASAFAAALLMPADDIKKDFEQGITITVLAGLKQKWKVSMIALLYRADDLGLLTPNQKRYLLQQFNHLKIRRHEPVELNIPAEQPQLVKQWIAGYRSKTNLGTAQMAALFGLYADEFMEMYL
jgi:Zn-dependent peptidase ImmA (M78 family)/DNA-binding XRE family transcriptional regulator